MVYLIEKGFIRLMLAFIGAIGFYPSQSPGLFIQNIYNDNRSQQVISPQVLDALGDYIEAEIIE